MKQGCSKNYFSLKHKVRIGTGLRIQLFLINNLNCPIVKRLTAGQSINIYQKSILGDISMRDLGISWAAMNWQKKDMMKSADL